jgi:riboflavin synthase
MFTGIIEGRGLVKTIRNKGVKVLLEIEIPKRVASSLKIGSSLAVNGVCLTVVSKRGGSVGFHLLKETLKRTSFGELEPKGIVNVERPMKKNARVDGHFVLGHVDGLGTVKKILAKGAEKNFLIAYPKSLSKYFVEKGSVAIDGISLTIGKISADGFWIHCIPHTLKSTNLSTLEVGSKLNLETDILAKLVLQK